MAKGFPRLIVKCSWDDRFGSLVVKIGGHDMEGSTITNIVIAKTEKFTDPTHIVPADAPIILCEQSNCFYACLYVEESSRNMENGSKNQTYTPVVQFYFLLEVSTKSQ